MVAVVGHMNTQEFVMKQDIMEDVLVGDHHITIQAPGQELQHNQVLL
jgi:hypothetical protein